MCFTLTYATFFSDPPQDPFILDRKGESLYYVSLLNTLYSRG
jgi:hypothetical protein